MLPHKVTADYDTIIGPYEGANTDVDPLDRE